MALRGNGGVTLTGGEVMETCGPWTLFQEGLDRLPSDTDDDSDCVRHRDKHVGEMILPTPCRSPMGYPETTAPSQQKRRLRALVLAAVMNYKVECSDHCRQET
jgi:hypothetical protein